MARSGWQGPRRGAERVAYEELRKRVLAAARYRCQVGTPGVCQGEATTLDHIRPLALGGSLLDPRNCRAACAPCNLTMGAKLGGQRRQARRSNASRVW